MKKIREYLGITNEDFELLDNYNILLEGESDKKYLSEISNYFGINVPNIISSGGATKIDKYLEFYNNFYTGREIKPKIRVIFDNDEEGRKEFNRIRNKIRTFKNITVTLEFIPNCFGETPNLEEVAQSKIKSNYEVEDFIYPEILHYLSTELSKKVNLKTFKFKNLENKIKAPTFKDKGILYNIELLKNENNLNEGLKVDFSGEQAKNGMVNLFNIRGNKKLSEMIIKADYDYPEVKKFLEKISKP